MTKQQIEDACRIDAIRTIMLNGFTEEEATKIYSEFMKRKAIRITAEGSWQFTSTTFAEKEAQELALDLANNPQPKGQESDKASDPYSEGWRAFEQGGREADNPYKHFPIDHKERWKSSDWEYGYHTRASAPKG